MVSKPNVWQGPCVILWYLSLTPPHVLFLSHILQAVTAWTKSDIHIARVMLLVATLLEGYAAEGASFLTSLETSYGAIGSAFDTYVKVLTAMSSTTGLKEALQKRVEDACRCVR